MVSQKQIYDLSYQVIGCAIEVHRQLGPGLLESIYEACFTQELRNAGLEVKSQLMVPIKYKEDDLGGNLKLDLLINEQIIVEIKAVEILIPLFKAQLLSYLKLTGITKGLLINFNSENLKGNILSMVTPSFKKLPSK